MRYVAIICSLISWNAFAGPNYPVDFRAGEAPTSPNPAIAPTTSNNGPTSSPIKKEDDWMKAYYKCNAARTQDSKIIESLKKQVQTLQDENQKLKERLLRK